MVLGGPGSSPGILLFGKCSGVLARRGNELPVGAQVQIGLSEVVVCKDTPSAVGLGVVVHKDTLRVPLPLPSSLEANSPGFDIAINQ